MMRIVLFCHSLLSDWNHGNAHFLRGIVTDMLHRGWEVRVYEPANGWSLANLSSEHGDEPLQAFRSAYPLLESIRYDGIGPDLDEALEGADVVLVHEWNEPELVRRIGIHRAGTSGYVLFFHDTHHRSVTDPDAMKQYVLEQYDGVLAFGESVSEQYRKQGWGRRVWTWHEAADHRIFHPVLAEKVGDLAWVGNWGDNERAEELEEFLMNPVRELGLTASVHGVRYPGEAIALLAASGIEYCGWLPNFQVPTVFGQHRTTVHIPRRPYATALPGVPTIRVFEALACGIPLVSAPWSDLEGLFNAGTDFLVAQNGDQMKQHLRTLLNDEDYASEIADHGRQTVLSRHTCAHRVDELREILHEVRN